MAKLETESINVSSLFSKDRFFLVPNYQRPFSWGEEHFDDLVTDTMNADRENEYFLGTIVLYREEATSTFVVVDGQQRLTSLLILLACIRDSLEDEKYKSGIQDKILQEESKLDGIPQRERLEVRDRNIFNAVVVTPGGTNVQFDENDLTESQRRYLLAAGIFHTKISDLSQAQLQDLAEFIAQKCVLIYLTANSFEQAFRLFEIVNDRGKQLRRIDVLKSINISPDVIAQETVRNRIAQKWEDLENEIGESDFESVFFLLRLILTKDKPKGDLLKEFQDRIFKKSLLLKGEPFAESLFRYVKHYRDIFIDQNYLDETDENGVKFQSLIFIMNNEFKASEWKACLLYFAEKFGRNKFYEFCVAIEKLFLTQWVASVRKDERHEAYAKILHIIEETKDPLDVIGSVNFDEKSIEEAARRENVYGAGFCKYFLLRLELLASEHDVRKEIQAKSIEHVFPQNPDEESEWAKMLSEQERAKVVNKLGNLVLLSKSRNSSASNKEFGVKKEKYLGPRVTDYPRSVQVLGYNAWTPEVINQRTDEAAKMITKDI